MSTPRPTPALARITRVMALALGTGGLVFCALAASDFLDQFSRFAPWWTIGSAVGFGGSLVVLAGLSWLVSASVLRRVAGAVAFIYLAGMLTVIPALGASQLDAGARPWLTGLATIGASAAAVAWRPPFAWAFLIGVVALIGINEAMVHRPIDGQFVVQETIFDAFFAAVFVVLAIATRRAGQKLDAAAASAIAEVRRSATAQARDSERARIDALVHDSVLVALLASTNAIGRAQTDAAAVEARSALRQLDVFRDDVPENAARASVDALWDLQAVATEIAPQATFSYELDGAADVPAAAVAAAAEALTEALRNSLAHADPPGGVASRAVHVRIDDDGFELTVLDDGTGFDPRVVGPTRLGIAVSIVGRMAGQSGGDARVVSRPGTGTRVSIRWRADV